MILFYNKKTGAIVGTIDGRVHTEDHLTMWVGSKEDNDRLVVEWKPTGQTTTVERIKKDERGNEVVDKIALPQFAPHHPQQDLFTALEQNPHTAYTYRVDPKTKTLLPQ